MKKEYAVYTDDAMVCGVYDNDLMDWFPNYEEAKSFAISKAKEDNATVYLSEVEDGDFSDEPETY